MSAAHAAPLLLLRHFRLPEEGEGAGGSHGPTEPPADASYLGLKIFLASLTMLFGATLLGYLLTRSRVDVWSGYDVPGLLPLACLATAALGLVSFALERARRAPGGEPARRWTLAALAGALGYLATQSTAWWCLAQAHGGLKGSADVSLFLFFALTGLHALHVTGGLGPIVWCLLRPSRRRTLRLAALYWHYLGVVWIVLAAALWWP